MNGEVGIGEVGRGGIERGRGVGGGQREATGGGVNADIEELWHKSTSNDRRLSVFMKCMNCTSIEQKLLNRSDVPTHLLILCTVLR